MLEHRDLTDRVIGLAIEVHRTVGRGLLESVYETGLCVELELAGIPSSLLARGRPTNPSRDTRIEYSRCSACLEKFVPIHDLAISFTENDGGSRSATEGGYA